MAEAYYEFGLMYAEKQDKEQALDCFLRSKELFSQLGAANELSRLEEALEAIT